MRDMNTKIDILMKDKADRNEEKVNEKERVAAEMNSNLYAQLMRRRAANAGDGYDQGHVHRLLPGFRPAGHSVLLSALSLALAPPQNLVITANKHKVSLDVFPHSRWFRNESTSHLRAPIELELARRDATRRDDGDNDDARRPVHLVASHRAPVDPATDDERRSGRSLPRRRLARANRRVVDALRASRPKDIEEAIARAPWRGGLEPASNVPWTEARVVSTRRRSSRGWCIARDRDGFVWARTSTPTGSTAMDTSPRLSWTPRRMRRGARGGTWRRRGGWAQRLTAATAWRTRPSGRADRRARSVDAGERCIEGISVGFRRIRRTHRLLNTRGKLLACCGGGAVELDPTARHSRRGRLRSRSTDGV